MSKTDARKLLGHFQKTASSHFIVLLVITPLAGCAGMLHTAQFAASGDIALVEGSADGTGDTAPASETDTTVTVTAPEGIAWRSFLIDLGPHFLAENICDGKTIFGRLGEALCGALVDNRLRDKGGTTRRLVPIVASDTDGYQDTNVDEVDHTVLNACGTMQATIDGRIADCSLVNGAAAMWSGAQEGNAGHGDWKLVTKIANGNAGKEVWRDERTQLLWSDNLSNINGSGVPTGGTSQQNFGWCFASGNTQNAGGIDCRTGVVGSHNRAAVSLCAEVGGLLTPNGAHSASTAANSLVSWISTGTAIVDAKGGMLLNATASSPSVTWRLPTRADYLQAYANGMGYVLPRFLSPYFWTSSVAAYDLGFAWLFNVDALGNLYLGAPARTDAWNTRCVGQD